MKVYRLAEWRGSSHSTRDRQQRERVAVGLLCIYLLFRSRDPPFFRWLVNMLTCDQVFLTITLESSETRALLPRKRVLLLLAICLVKYDGNIHSLIIQL